MDRGVVSEANLEHLRERKARYLVGTPKSWLRAHEQTLLEQTDWKTVQDGLVVRLVEKPGGEPGERFFIPQWSAGRKRTRDASTPKRAADGGVDQNRCVVAAQSADRSRCGWLPYRSASRQISGRRRDRGGG